MVEGIREAFWYILFLWPAFLIEIGCGNRKWTTKVAFHVIAILTIEGSILWLLFPSSTRPIFGVTLNPHPWAPLILIAIVVYTWKYIHFNIEWEEIEDPWETDYTIPLTLAGIIAMNVGVLAFPRILQQVANDFYTVILTAILIAEVWAANFVLLLFLRKVLDKLK